MTAVFVSSTFADLKEFRASVRSAIRRLGLVDIAMEHFGSRDERPIDECKRVINKECDLFVGIYAKRYGFIPEGEKTSITAAGGGPLCFSGDPGKFEQLKTAWKATM
jgi:Domain of unknown function (DUF4062)